MRLPKIDYVLFFLMCGLFLSPSRVSMQGILEIDYENIGYAFSFVSYYTILIIITSLYIRLRYKIPLTVKKSYVFFAFIFIGIQIIAFLKHPNISFLETLSHIFTFLLATFLVSQIVTTLILELSAYYACLISLFIVCMVSPLGLTFYSIYGEGFKRAGSLGFSPNDLAIVGLVTLVFARFINNKVFKVLFFISGATALIFSASRKALLILLAYLLSRSKKALFISTLIALIVYLNASSILEWMLSIASESSIPFLSRFAFIASDKNTNLQEAFTDYDRIDFYSIFFKRCSEVLFLGEYSINNVSQKFLNGGTMHFHNFLFEWVLLFGFIGALILLTWVYNVFSVSYKLYTRGKLNNSNILFFHLFAAFLIFNLLDYSFFNQKLVFILIFSGEMLVQSYSLKALNEQA